VRKLLIIPILALFVFALFGCAGGVGGDSGQTEAVVGSWDVHGQPFKTFRANGTGTNHMIGEFQWSTRRGVMTIRGFGVDQEWSYEIRGNQMTMTLLTTHPLVPSSTVILTRR